MILRLVLLAAVALGVMPAADLPVLSVQNGVAYSTAFPGASLGERVNACILVAETGANGATTHECSSLGEPCVLAAGSGINQQTNIGDAASDAVTWRVPSCCLWAAQLTGGNQAAVMQYNKSSIVGDGEQRGSCVIYNASGPNGAKYLYDEAGQGFYHLVGLSFRNAPGQGNYLAGGVVAKMRGALDESYFAHFTIDNYVPHTIGQQWGDSMGGFPCCAATEQDVAIQGNYTGGTQLSLEQSAGAQGIVFISLSLGHAAPGVPTLVIDDPSYQAHVTFVGLYDEISSSPNVIAGYSFANGTMTVTNVGANPWAAGAKVALTGLANPTYAPIFQALMLNQGYCTVLASGLTTTTASYNLPACSNWSKLTAAQQSTLTSASGAAIDGCYRSICGEQLVIPGWAPHQIKRAAVVHVLGSRTENFQNYIPYNGPIWSILPESHTAVLLLDGATVQHGMTSSNAMVYDAALSQPYVAVSGTNGVLTSYRSGVSDFDTVNALNYLGPLTAPTGTCSVVGQWVLSQDGHVTFCDRGTWVTKI